MADDRKNDKVRVVDRRWFNADGDLKDPTSTPPAEPSAPTPPAPTMPEPVDAGGPASAGEHPPSAVGLLDLVDFLAQQAVALLSGQVPGRGRDPVAARFFIDLLGVVQEKTTGQLAPEENRYLEDILFQLRSLFVAATR